MVDFKVGDRVIVRSTVNTTEPPEHGVIKVIQSPIDPNSGRRVIRYGVLYDGIETPEFSSELVELLDWVSKENLISE